MVRLSARACVRFCGMPDCVCLYASVCFCVRARARQCVKSRRACVCARVRFGVSLGKAHRRGARDRAAASERDVPTEHGHCTAGPLHAPPANPPWAAPARTAVRAHRAAHLRACRRSPRHRTRACPLTRKPPLRLLPARTMHAAMRFLPNSPWLSALSGPNSRRAVVCLFAHGSVCGFQWRAGMHTCARISAGAGNAQKRLPNRRTKNEQRTTNNE